ncbi:MAG: adenosylcobinamide-GDP ribazoletransferase [Actinomycetota bacterium]|nr:adenosylcobinamide-GDP ribazoletransferase [Actinomycetota bacterium]
MLWSPLVGAGLAGVAGLVLVVARRLYEGPTFYIQNVKVQAFEAPLLASALAILALALLTRGLHLDGLADTVDGLASRKPADQALAIMSEGPVGALGVAALIGVLLVDVLALASSVLAHHGTQSLVFGLLSGRLAMLWACTAGIPAARTGGMGALVAGTVSRPVAVLWTLVVGAGAAAYGRFDTEVGSNAGAIRGVVAVVLALAVAWIVRRHAVRRFGGVTGDVLGALCEIATMVSLLVTAAGGP